MKHRFCFFASIFIAFSTLSADVDSGDYGSEKIENLRERPTPFKIDLRTDVIGEADTTSGKLFKGEKLHYSESQADISGVFYYNECHKEALLAQFAFNSTGLYWSENPLYQQKYFNNYCFALAGVTQRLCGWTWQGYASINMDSKNVGLNNYSTYDLLMWGKYDYNDYVGVHVGFMGWTGLKIDKILPILGFDWTFCDKWTVSAVFPINISVIYAYSDCLNFTAAGRFFWNRHRLDENSRIPEGIWEYRNAGAELGVNYIWRQLVNLNIHAGWTFGGNVRISNKNHKHTRKYEFDGAPYVGGEASVRF